MRCEEVGDRFVEQLSGALDAADADVLAAHLASCPQCRAEHADLAMLWNELGRMPAPPVPSRRLRERFSVMIAAERASMPQRPASRQGLESVSTTSTHHTWGLLAQLAVAASLLLVGALAGRALSPTPPRTDNELAEMRGELRSVRQMLTLSLLQQQSATERLRGVSWTAQIERPDAEIVTALLDTLLHDPNVNVRLAAVDALRRVSDQSEVRAGMTRAASDTTAPLVQVAVIDFLMETRDPQASALLRRMVEDQSLDGAVRARAQWALARLSS